MAKKEVLGNQKPGHVWTMEGPGEEKSLGSGGAGGGRLGGW